MKTTDIKETIRAYIIEQFIKKQGNIKLEDDDSFFEKHIIDSTGLLELVLFIEETFGIKVEDEELIPENLDSLNRLKIYISSKLNK